MARFKPATASQKQMIGKLAAELGVTVDTRRLSRDAARRKIDALKRRKRKKPLPALTIEQQRERSRVLDGSAPMSNRHADRLRQHGSAT